MKHNFVRTALHTAVAGLLVLPSLASAGAWSLAGVPSTAPLGGGAASPVVQVQFAGDGNTFDAQTSISIPAGFTAAVAGANGGGCGIVGSNINVTSSTAILIAAGPTTFCNVTFTAQAATPVGNYNITANGGIPTGCFDSGGNTVATCTAHSNGTGALIVSAGPAVGPTITYTPAAGGNVTFGAATSIGGTTTQAITLAGAGGQNNGTTVLSACSSTVGNITFTDGADTCTAGASCADADLTLQCVATNAAQNGTASCTETRQNEVTAGDGGTAVATRTWNVSCPAANVAPALAYNPTSGTGITMPQVGQGQTASSSIAVTPSAGSGTSTSTVSGCAFSAVSGATFNVTSGTLTFTGSGTAAQNIGFTCVAPTNGQPDGTATLTCAQTIGGGAPTNVSWPVTCPDGLPVAAPNVTYTPAGGTTITFGAGASVGASVPGSSSVAVDINGGANGGAPAPETTSVSCTATAGFTVSGGSAGPVSAPAPAGTDTTVNVSCTSGASAQAGTLTCVASQVIDGGAPTTTNTTFPLDCAAADVNITSTPGEGAITVTGAPNTSVGSAINLSNSGSASTLTCTATGSVTLGTVPATVPASGSAAVPFTCLTGAPGLNNPGTIQCTTQDLGAEGTLDYTVACIGVADVPVPAINNLGKVLMVVLVIGLGLVGLGARRQ